MHKYLVIILVALSLISCTAKNEQYYRAHPKEIQKALESCPSQQPSGISCEQLQQLSKRMNSLGYQLQSNPQGFGAKILTLQHTIAIQEQQLKGKPSSELNTSLAQNKHTLEEYLAIVKWLESPEG